MANRLESEIQRNEEASMRASELAKENDELKSQVPNLQKVTQRTQDDSELKKDGDFSLEGIKIFLEDTPVLFFDGKASLTVTTASAMWGYCSLKVFSLINNEENTVVEIKKVTPNTFHFNGKKYAIHLVSVAYSGVLGRPNQCRLEFFEI
jgi:hypothetical protein